MKLSPSSPITSPSLIPSLRRTVWQRRRRLTLALLTATAGCIVLWFGREHMRVESRLPMMLPNLALAWMPYLLALALEALLESLARVRDQTGLKMGDDDGFPSIVGGQPGVWRPWLVVCFGVLWLMFLPNASYLVTDGAHWQPGKGMPVWWDLIYLCALAWTGLCLTYGSVAGLHEWVARRGGARAGWAFALAALALATAGVYVGRFWRWNSWEVATRPAVLAADVARLADGGVAHRAAVFAAGFFTLCVMSYGLLHLLAGDGGAARTRMD